MEIHQAELLAQDNEAAASDADDHDMVYDGMTVYDELMKIIADIMVDSARTRKQVNYVIRHNLTKDS